MFQETVQEQVHGIERDGEKSGAGRVAVRVLQLSFSAIKGVGASIALGAQIFVTTLEQVGQLRS